MTGRPLRILHAIHDFLPRHQAGSEMYADSLARRQATRHHVTVLCAEFDPARAHGSVHWRMHDGPAGRRGREQLGIATPSRTRTGRQSLRAPLDHVLRATEPDVVHVHNLLNLSFDLPVARARARSGGRGDAARLHGRVPVGRPAACTGPSGTCVTTSSRSGARGASGSRPSRRRLRPRDSRPAAARAACLHGGAMVRHGCRPRPPPPHAARPRCSARDA